jgi:hypothetical protein
MLDIRTFRSRRKGVRVDLYRKYKHTDVITGKVKFSYKQLGSFSLSEGYHPELIERLQPEEIIQLQNWLAEARFGEQFNVPADELMKCTLHLPSVLYEALTQLYIECKRVEIDFIPYQVMLDALLYKAKLVQRKLDHINGFNSGILERIGIDTQALPKEAEISSLPKESHLLFKALLDLKQPLGKICDQLEAAAQHYGKQQRIPPAQLREWAGDLPHRNPNKRIKKWAYVIAMDVLQQQGINPLTIETPELVARYWAVQQQSKYTLEAAKQEFIQRFAVPDALRQTVLDIITQVYKGIIR